MAILLGAARPRADIALFRRQQAVEKAWKGFLFWHDVPFWKTHNLRELSVACVVVDGSLRSVAERAAKELAPFVRVFRSPGEPEAPSLADAEAVLTWARTVGEAVLACLPEEVHL